MELHDCLFLACLINVAFICGYAGRGYALASLCCSQFGVFCQIPDKKAFVHKIFVNS